MKRALSKEFSGQRASNRSGGEFFPLPLRPGHFASLKVPESNLKVLKDARGKWVYLGGGRWKKASNFQNGYQGKRGTDGWR